MFRTYILVFTIESNHFDEQNKFFTSIGVIKLVTYKRQGVNNILYTYRSHKLLDSFFFFFLAVY